MVNKKLIKKYTSNGFKEIQINHSSDFVLLTAPMDGGLIFSTVPLYQKIRESEMGLTIIDSKKDLNNFIKELKATFLIGSSKDFMEEVARKNEEKPMAYYSSQEYFDEIGEFD